MSASHVAFGNCVVLRATCCQSVEWWRRRGRGRQYICYYRVEREGSAVPSRSYAIDGRLLERAAEGGSRALEV